MKVFITGASKGLGKALAGEFLSRGAEVWGVARSEASAEAGKTAGGFTYTRCDCTRPEEIIRTAAEMKGRGFIPDIAVFCAGSAADDVKGGIDHRAFKSNFEANLFGTILWVEEFLPLFLKRKSGVFAAVSSLSVYRENHKNRIAYSSSKLALTKAFENLRVQFYSSGVNFTVFHPGRMSSEKSSIIGTTYDKAARLMAKKLLSGNCPAKVDFPALQYCLTLLTRFVPDGIYHRYIFK